MNAGGGSDRAIRGIPQNAQGRHLQRDFVSQRQHSEYGTGIQVSEEVIQGHFEWRFISACQERDFQQANCAKRYRLSSANRRFERAQLDP
jgi:hypothetical protein